MYIYIDRYNHVIKINSMAQGLPKLSSASSTVSAAQFLAPFSVAQSFVAICCPRASAWSPTKCQPWWKKLRGAAYGGVYWMCNGYVMDICIKSS